METYPVFLRRHDVLSRYLVAGAEQIDIGLPYCRPRRTKEVRERRQVMKENKKNVELERSSRLRTCKHRPQQSYTASN